MKRIQYGLLEGLIHATKYEKTASANATKEFFMEGKEIALALINNYDLIIQRVELLIKKANTKAMKEINTFQTDINNSLQNFRNKFYLSKTHND